MMWHTHLQICHIEGNKENFQLTVDMAKAMLPHQTLDIDSIVADYRNLWEGSMDMALAEKIILKPSDEKRSDPTQFQQD